MDAPTTRRAASTSVADIVRIAGAVAGASTTTEVLHDDDAPQQFTDIAKGRVCRTFRQLSVPERDVSCRDAACCSACGGTVIFDTKRVDGKPRRFTAGGNVRPQGLERAIVGAQAGAKRIATLPPGFSYGSAGLPASSIPPNATIIYEFEVVEIRAKK